MIGRLAGSGLPPRSSRRAGWAIAGGLTIVWGLARASIGAAGAEVSATSSDIVVSVVRAERQCRRDLLPASGLLVARTQTDVRAERSDLLVGRLLVEPGETVSVGQVLARLVPQAGGSGQTVAIRAPVAGTVIGIETIVGSATSPDSGVPLFRIIPEGALELSADVLAKSVRRLQIGQPAALAIVGLEPLVGSVVSIDKSVDETTQLGTVHISLPSDPRLKPGIFVNAEVDAGEVCDVAVPMSAVLFAAHRPMVRIVRDNRVETRQVLLGSFDQGRVHLRSGVEAGELVVDRAGGFVRDGDRIRPVLSGALPSP